MIESRALTLDSATGPVDGALIRPHDARALLVLAHGAGAGFDHANMSSLAEGFAGVGIATLRFNFPFIQAGRRRVDPPAVAVQTIADVHEQAEAFELPIFSGGHSFGGRMTTHAALTHRLPSRGLVLCSFPLHPAKKPGTARAAHLSEIDLPMLFLSGTRDDLADPVLLEETVAGLDHARLRWVDTANHGYVVLKRTRQDPRSAFTEIAESAAEFIAAIL